MSKLFFILNGNNGATYILNAKSWSTISHSLKFYKPHALKSELLKQGLRLYVWLLGKVGRFKLQDKAAITTMIGQKVNYPLDFDLDDNCSVLISPTKDKVIVNNHKHYFQKFAFGKSYANVKQESDIYKRLPLKSKAFQISEIKDVQVVMGEFCSFKLCNSNTLISKPTDIKPVLVPVLTEFFQYSQSKETTCSNYLENLFAALDHAGLPDFRLCWSAEMETNYGAISWPLGLVHRDFKPWNVLSYQKPLIYDFEETVLDGPPLEDLFNYHIDPIIRYNSPEDVTAIIFAECQINCYKEYLSHLNIHMTYKPFLIIYLLERILFYNVSEEVETSIKYTELFKYLILTENLKYGE
ncbi:phosphotransferase [Winogradskyella helgolandensis]|uniref:phosphotransferase n=1 Tax=Winogradskyella helgolandensis TaxID=2697010 RepID=UPI0015CE7AD2|nr:phosphotransferase [Winogradskyella helgolandensis]